MENKITCVIVDDEPLAVKLMRNYVERTDSLQLVATYSDSIKALNALKENPVNLVFLDIQMPKLSGMELSHILPKQTKIIFTTAFAEYALEGYEVSAVDYLLKPIKYPKFVEAVDKAKQWFEKDAHYVTEPAAEPPSKNIFVRADNEIKNIAVSDIIYVEAMKDYVRIAVKSQHTPITSHLTMKSIEASLPDSQFIRISRSVIVSIAMISNIDRNGCVYIAGKIFRVGETYRNAFDKFLKTRLIK